MRPSQTEENIYKTSLALVFCLIIPALPAQAPLSSAGDSLLGYTRAHSEVERDWEARFRAIPDAKRAKANLRLLAAHPHNVGSEAQRKNAEWILARYKEWGWDAHIEQFDVLYPTPKTMVLELIGPKPFKASLDEPPIAADPYTHERATQLPGYNIYSADGDVTGPLVYVNYGMVDDYAELERNGISVKGAIVIARNGNGWRGLKPKLAYEHGALGCIIYTDPLDQGYGKGDVIPVGPMRPSAGVQRGSVADIPLYPGDPLTPGVGAVPGAKRLSIKDAPSLMRIPVLPIGYGDAQPLLAALSGKVVPPAWRGSLPLAYHFGPGPAKVHLKLAFDWNTKPVLDVIATIRGAEEPDVWIVRGNHYDGWVNGADDPISGQSGLLEEARALGELYKQGWRPKRTLIYAAWDGEEPGLLGSTEWMETHAEELSQHAAIYVNTDESNRGFFSAGGSHSLEHLVNEVAHDITDPETHVSIWRREQAGILNRGTQNSTRTITPQSDSIPLEALGTGTDFASFMDHLGIASLNLVFGGEDQSGAAHSAYDTPWFIEHFGDRDSVYGVALAQTAGTLVMRAADADVLPYDFSNLADEVGSYSTELKALLKQRQHEATVRQQYLSMDVYSLAADPHDPKMLPQPMAIPPDLDFTELDNAILALRTAGERFNHSRLAAVAASSARLDAVNVELATAERRFINPDGLPRRPWTRNILYAPGWFTGYGVKTLPGVREAIEEGLDAEASSQMAVAAHAIKEEAEYIDRIAAELSAP